MIELNRVGFTVAGRQVVENLSLACPTGAYTALTGPSGCGKTTVLGIVGLLLRPTTGRVTVNGKDMTKATDRTRRAFWRQQAAFIYQDSGIIDEQTVAYNVTLRKLKRGIGAAHVPSEVEAVLSQVGLAGRARDRASVLSGGEKQRLGIARAIYKDAQYIFADEPTASLDQDNAAAITALLDQQVERGKAVIIATHDVHLAAHTGNAINLGATHPSPVQLPIPA